MKYIVMQTFTSYCVVMDEAGRFIKAANKNYELGGAVEYIEPMKTTRSFGKRAFAALGGLAACFAVALAVYAYHIMFGPFAYVYLSINPAVRMDVSRSGRVVAVAAVNDDGAALLEGYNAKRQTLEAVSDELVDRAIEQGFLADGGRVTVELDSTDERWLRKTETGLRQNLEPYLSERLSVTVEVKRYAAAAAPATAPAPAPIVREDDDDTAEDDEQNDNSEDAGEEGNREDDEYEEENSEKDSKEDEEENGEENGEEDDGEDGGEDGGEDDGEDSDNDEEESGDDEND